MAARLDLGMEWWLRVLALSLFAHEQLQCQFLRPDVPRSLRVSFVLETESSPRDSRYGVGHREAVKVVCWILEWGDAKFIRIENMYSLTQPFLSWEFMLGICLHVWLRCMQKQVLEALFGKARYWRPPGAHQ